MIEKKKNKEKEKMYLSTDNILKNLDELGDIIEAFRLQIESASAYYKVLKSDAEYAYEKWIGFERGGDMTYEEYSDTKKHLQVEYDDMLRLAENKRHVLEALINGLRHELKDL